jgi:hypothetical protein
MKKAFWLAIPVGLAALVAAQWQDITRYLKIKQISMGNGHPENVPAHGRTAYPERPAPSGDPRRGGEF